MIGLMTSMMLAVVAPAVDAAVYCLPSTPVGVYPPAGLAAGYGQRGPTLFVVDTDIRPGSARLYLDGRYIGRADDFDGWPDYLYLEPGRYRLEARLGGYRSAIFEIDATPAARGDVKHRLVRLPGERRERRADHADDPAPVARVFGVASLAGDSRAGGTTGGPPPAAAPSASQPLEPTRGEAQLRPTVTPPAASLYIDGRFIATGAELARLERPLAVAPGRHVVEALLPGHTPARRELEIAAGDVSSIELAVGD